MDVLMPRSRPGRERLLAALSRRCAFLLAALCVAAVVPHPVLAQVLINPIAVTSSNFTYGNLSFAITSCSFIFAGGSTSCGSDGSELIGVFSGRGGTEIELLSPSGAYTQSAGQANTSLSFAMTVSDRTGSRGLSSISNILTGSVNNSADNSLLSSVLSSASFATATSNAGSLTSTASFALTKNPVSFNFSINLNTATAKAGDTLTLSNVKLLFQPAPEPASIAVLLTGLGGLAVMRRRFRRSPHSPAHNP
jgi:hypothetical protein